MKAIAGLLLLLFVGDTGARPVVVGSKKFTESYVLAEIALRALGNAGFTTTNRTGLGGTIIVWEALRTGQIDCYPEYTGTLTDEILKQPGLTNPAAMRTALEPLGIGMTSELGFNNTYALVMTRGAAAAARIRTISDLRAHPELRFGLTHEFIERQDGWRPLAARYQLPAAELKAIDHGLGYEALRTGQIDVKDAYSTDAKIAENDLVVLEDDLEFFPQYKAVFLYRLSLDPPALAALEKIAGTLGQERMTRLNAEAERTRNYAHAADVYFTPDGAPQRNTATASLARNIARWTTRHLELAGVSLLLSVLVGIPLGIVASRGGVVGHAILGFTSAVQTIPSLALLALLVPLPFFGISARTAIAALFLYGLLPIVRNTATGLQDIAAPLRESAIALGLTPAARLTQIYLPLASRSILAGIKTSAVINIGTATLAALIGAGGLGEPIISGLNLNDHRTILQGAIPAAILALIVQWLFDLLDRVVIPRGLRL